MKNKVEDKDIAYNFAVFPLPPPISCEAAQTGE
jgi:hypothetical protein